MRLRIIWPGKTRNQDMRSLQDFYLKKINRLEKCEIIETKEARGIAEKFEKKIKKIEGEALEKYLNDGYIICLSDRGQEMSSTEFALLALSKMTFSHELARLILLEQIYRSLTIIKGIQYAK